ncbi:MAG: hypothetical protein JW709_03685 [Sedimentisphaerales bacterium]|nr:hypothetical protein [Sedimentisphaerales bacterium]
MTQEMDDMRQKVETLRAEKEALAAEVQHAQQSAALTNALAQAGATDMEVALLLAQQHAAEGEEGTFDAHRAVAAVREQRPWLFGEESGRTKQPGLTAGARHNNHGGTLSLASLADKARQTGSVKDLHVYMQARRNRK